MATPADVIKGHSRNKFDISPVLQCHVWQLRTKIQRLAGPRIVPRKPILRDQPFGLVPLGQGLADWELLNGQFRASRLSAPRGTVFDLVPKAAGKKLSLSSQEDAFYSPPDSPGQFPLTSTPKSKTENLLSDLAPSKDRLLPSEYLKPPTFPTLRHAGANEGFAPSTSRVQTDGGPAIEADFAAFIAEYEQNKRRLEERRRAERIASARPAAAEVCGTSVERFRSSLNDLSLIIDEMADLMHIGVAEASASEVQERAEALWGKEMAAQLSEEWSRELSSREAEGSGPTDRRGRKPGTQGRLEGISREALMKEGHTAHGKRVAAVDPGQSRSTKEECIRRTKWPIAGPEEMSHPSEKRDRSRTPPTEMSSGKSGEREEEGPVRRTKWPVTGPEEICRRSERRGEGPVSVPTGPSLRTWKDSGQEERICQTMWPLTGPKEMSHPSQRREAGSASAQKVGQGSKKTDSSKVSFRTANSRDSTEGSHSDSDSEAREAMMSQRIWKFEESTTDDVLDKGRQRRAEICRTTIGSLPVEQKVANVRLVGPKKKKKQKKMCNLKIVCIVSPAGDLSASSRSDVRSRGSDSKSEQQFHLKSESRFEDAAGYF